MNWKLKIGIQNYLSLLPTSVYNNLYYLLQRKLGSCIYLGCCIYNDFDFYLYMEEIYRVIKKLDKNGFNYKRESCI